MIVMCIGCYPNLYIIIYLYHPLKNLNSLLLGLLFGGSILSIADLIATSLSDCA